MVSTSFCLEFERNIFFSVLLLSVHGFKMHHLESEYSYLLILSALIKHYHFLSAYSISVY
jgi:hypothetical protein